MGRHQNVSKGQKKTECQKSDDTVPVFMGPGGVFLHILLQIITDSALTNTAQGH